MGRNGSVVLVKTIVLAALVVLPTSSFAQTDAAAKRIDVRKELIPCLSLSQTTKQNITVEQEGKCCSACVQVVSSVATNATDYWDQLYLYRMWASIIATIVVFLMILGVSWLGIRRCWRLGFWLIPIGLALVGAFSAVLVERQILAVEEGNLLSADLVLRDVVAVGLGANGKTPLTCPEAIKKQGLRASSGCIDSLKEYPGLFFPGFNDFDNNVSENAKMEAVKERADDARSVLTEGNADIQPNFRPDSVQKVYDDNPILNTASVDWLGPFKFDWLLPVIVFVASLALAVVFGVIKKYVNIRMATRRQWNH